ncbi:hypothetical protein FDUTEX481_09323 [Tolypothrix sp. PCC 7601]|nr:hypothetical protein FDUTEX481_09323 [Tolypothrix sp. PCC 7601]
MTYRHLIAILQNELPTLISFGTCGGTQQHPILWNLVWGKDERVQGSFLPLLPFTDKYCNNIFPMPHAPSPMPKNSIPKGMQYCSVKDFKLLILFGKRLKGKG